jgi:ATP-dependent protease ClpP protease subunit
MKLKTLITSMLLMLTTTIALAKDVTLTSDNVLILNDAVDGETVAKIMKKATELNAKLPSKEPIYLVLYTPGGSIQDGIEMITFLKSLNRPVHTISIFAASMGFQTVQGLGERYVTEFGTLMAHKAKGSFSGEFPGQIDSRYVYYLQRLNELDKKVVARSKGKLTMEKFRAMYENEHWVEGQAAVNEGLADSVVTVRCDQSLSGTHQQVYNFFGFTIALQYSNCPMITSPIAVEVMVHTDRGMVNLDKFLQMGGSLVKKSTYERQQEIEINKTVLGPNKLPDVPEISVEGVTIEKINAEITKIKDSLNLKKQFKRE